MIASIAWKEWREQRAIALAVLAFGAGALGVTALLADPASGSGLFDRAGPRELMAQGLAYLAGSVCGAMLLADEKEVGTLEFLDTLPCRRLTLWIGKAAFGFLLTTVQCAVVAGLAVAMESNPRGVSPVGYGLFLVAVGWLAFAWGLFGGSLARSTLGAVFQGSVGSFTAAILLVVPFAAVLSPRSFSRGPNLGLIGYYAAWLGTGLLASAFFFTALDRRRKMGTSTASRGGVASATSSVARPKAATPRAMIWLTARQALLLTLATAAAAIVVGGIMLVDDVRPLLVWPSVTLGLGVLAGVTVFAEEQNRGVARFWAERRLPLGRFWATKVAFHFALAAGAGLLAFLPLVATDAAQPFRTRLLTRDVLGREELGRFLWLGLVYGFVVGHLAGLVFRKTLVAGLAATVVAAALAGTLFPSVVGGGARSWQVWGPAIVLLGTARWLIYPWATDRVTARGPMWRAIGGTAAALTVFAAAIGYRIVEVPDTEDRMAAAGFTESIPLYDVNYGGREALSATGRFRRSVQDHDDLYPRVLTNPPQPKNAPERVDSLEVIARSGDFKDHKRWLKAVFEDDWRTSLDAVLTKPGGVYQDPRDTDLFTNREPLTNLRDMCLAINIRGRERAQDGDPAEMPKLLPGALAIVRTARTKATVEGARESILCEEILFDGLRAWLNTTDGTPELLRPLLAVCRRHEAEMPTDTTEIAWAEQVVLRNTMDRVGSWVPTLLDRGPRNGEPSTPADTEAEVVAFSWSVPWERIRRERLLRQLTTERPVEPARLSRLHLPTYWRRPPVEGLVAWQNRGRLNRRAAIVLLELRLHALETGSPAASLDDLRDELPTDPYTGGPFGYRVSKGELIAGGPDILREPSLRHYYPATAMALTATQPLYSLHPTWWMTPEANPSAPTGMGRISASLGASASTSFLLNVRPGTAVLWSSGPDGVDDGGHRAGPSGMMTQGHLDWIVPLRSPKPR